MILEETLPACPLWIQSAWASPLGLSSGTTLRFLFIVISRPVPVQGVFLLTTQSVGTLINLTKTVFCLPILVSLLLVFISIYLLPLLIFNLVFTLCLPVISSRLLQAQ
jgi:hypothetical protein